MHGGNAIARILNYQKLLNVLGQCSQYYILMGGSVSWHYAKADIKMLLKQSLGVALATILMLATFGPPSSASNMFDFANGKCTDDIGGGGTGGTGTACTFACEVGDVISVEATSADSDATVVGDAECGGAVAHCSGKQSCNGNSIDWNGSTTTEGDNAGACSAKSHEFWDSWLEVVCSSYPQDAAEPPVDPTDPPQKWCVVSVEPSPPYPAVCLNRPPPQCFYAGNYPTPDAVYIDEDCGVKVEPRNLGDGGVASDVLQRVYEITGNSSDREIVGLVNVGASSLSINMGAVAPWGFGVKWAGSALVIQVFNMDGSEVQDYALAIAPFLNGGGFEKILSGATVTVMVVERGIAHGITCQYYVCHLFDPTLEIEDGKIRMSN